MNEDTDGMLQSEIIEPSASPWGSCILLRRKKSKDGNGKYKLHVDCRALNAVIKPDAYPVLNVVDRLDLSRGIEIYCVLDTVWE
jgi:hypothetical protein